MNIFLDDERNPEDVTWIMLPNVTWTVVRTPDEFLQTVTENPLKIDIITFDNDIQHQLEGYDLIKMICDKDMDNDYKLLLDSMQVFAHTMNMVNREPILNYWNNYLEHKLSMR